MNGLTTMRVVIGAVALSGCAGGSQDACRKHLEEIAVQLADVKVAHDRCLAEPQGDAKEAICRQVGSSLDATRRAADDAARDSRADAP